MLRRLSLGLLAFAISIAALPAIAQEDGGADDLGVMSISLKDVVKPTIGFQGALQGAGTPNQAGIGGFLPLSVGEKASGFLMSSLTPTLLTEQARAASSTPMLLVPRLVPHQGLVTAG